LFRGEVRVASALRAFLANLMIAGTNKRERSTVETTVFQDRMAEGLRSFQHPVLLILSGRDLTAKEFLEHAQSNPRWAGLLERANIVRHDLPEADHTFSSASWSRDVEARTLRWLQESFS
jgi:uncharacterized protein